MDEGMDEETQRSIDREVRLIGVCYAYVTDYGETVVLDPTRVTVHTLDHTGMKFTIRADAETDKALRLRVMNDPEFAAFIMGGNESGTSL